MTALSEAVRAELRHLLEHEPEYLRHLLQHEAGAAHAAEQLSTGALGASNAGESAGTAAAAGAADAGGGGADFASDAGGTSGDTGGDTMTPSHLYIDATGKTYGLFSGGVVLPEQPGATFNPQGSVQWTSDGTPTGTVEEYIQGALVGAIHELLLQSRADINDQAIVALETIAAGAAGSSQVVISAADGHGLQTVTAMDSLGRSGFPQLPPSPGTPATLRTQALWGHFTAGSIAPAAGSSGGFAVVKTAVGQYTITWGSAFTSAGYGFVPVAIGGYCDVLAGSQAAGSVVVELRSFADALTDLPWNFVAIGVY